MACHCVRHTNGFLPVGVSTVALRFDLYAQSISDSLITFSLAMGWVCFHDTSAATRCVVGIAVVFALLLLGGVVYNGEWNIQSKAITALKERAVRTKKLVKGAKKMPRHLSHTIRRLSTDVLKWQRKASSNSEPAESAVATRTSVTERIQRMSLYRRYTSWRSGDDTIVSMTE